MEGNTNHAAQCATLIAPYESALFERVGSKLPTLQTGSHCARRQRAMFTGCPLAIDCTMASKAATVSTICSGVIG